jgi:1-acyl-sn-glycerol-3-phosphate acyltransferase
MPVNAPVGAPTGVPVSNPILYAWRVLIKWLSFGLFGIGTSLLVTAVFPPMRLLMHPRERFQAHARRLVSLSFRLFAFIMYALGAVELDADNRETYRKLSSKIIVANHPSLLDVVMLISLIPNADCIVREGLSHYIVRGIIRQLYIPNSLPFEDLIKACIGSLNQGNCIIIFPEGTRTPRSGKVFLKKGAARLSLLSGCGVIPVHIGGTDKYGLGKHDPWAAFNPRDKYVYRLRMGKEISPEKYAGVPVSQAVRRLHDEIRGALF